MEQKQNKDLSTKVDRILSERKQLRDLKQKVIQDSSIK
jgi:hypothetical protein